MGVRQLTFGPRKSVIVEGNGALWVIYSCSQRKEDGDLLYQLYSQLIGRLHSHTSVIFSAVCNAQRKIDNAYVMNYETENTFSLSLSFDASR